jgi:hypothetical protein
MRMEIPLWLCKNVMCPEGGAGGEGLCAACNQR